MHPGRIGSVLSLALVVAAAGACGSASSGGGSGSQRGTLVVYAAASLSDAFATLGHRFEVAHHGVTVKFNFGGSDSLAAGIVQGAPVDVFAAASPTTMDTAQKAHDTVGSVRTFAANRVELAVPPDNPAHIASLADSVKPGVKLALCAATVPCGAAARAAYAVDHLVPHPVSDEENVTAVLTKVELGEVDAGIVYQTDVRSTSKVHGIPLGAAAVITDYPIARVRSGTKPTLAQEFIDLVVSTQGRQVLSRAGFILPPSG